MILLKESDISKQAFRNAVLTVGVFDGVHKGHIMMLDKLVRLAKDSSSKSIVLTLAPDPEEILFPSDKFTVITPLDEKLKLLSKTGIDYCMVLNVDMELLLYGAIDFFNKYIWERFHPGIILAGEDFKFGKDKKGDIDLLRNLSQSHSFNLEIVPFFDYKGEKISSSRIRKALSDGDIDNANNMLGRPAHFNGSVVPGEGRGRTIGFPTANLVSDYVFTLKKGVYIGKAEIKSSRMPAVLYVGTAPTFGGKFLRYEAYIPNFSGYLYGKKIGFYLHQFLREERHFSGVEEVKEQLGIDRDCLLDYFAQGRLS
ncbi:MAG: riboflavin biosynthesis protein RibF [Candidatus Omnitrophica bacterium]|nr:riboflavin biosynthesis protein RibF [Candidatus Omnitrophota bacterium]